MPDEYSFNDKDFQSMLHPEGAPGTLNAVWGDKGTQAVIQQTVASSKYYLALAFRHEAVGAAAVTATIAALLAFIPALLLLWKVALG